MKCPVCGYENDSEDAVCIACGSDMARAAESIAIEKRRSEEAMERYHQQQRELRRELGIDEPEEAPLVMAGSGDDASGEAQGGGPWEASLELEEIPSDFHSNDVLCPQCGFRNRARSVECARCGVIFSKLKNTLGNGGGNGNGNGRAPAGERGGGSIDPSKDGLVAMPPVSEAPASFRTDPVADGPGESLVDTGPGYSPYVHEVKVEPWAGAKSTGRWVREAWRGANFAEKGKSAYQGILGLVQWLKKGEPKWYGVALGVVILMAALPFLWKGGGYLKGEWDRRSRAKLEATLVEEFSQNNGAIRAEIRTLANSEKFEAARAALARFDIPPLEEKIRPLKGYLEEKETYARVLKVPSWKFETNYNMFTRLVSLNPSNAFYRSKQAHYMEKLAERCYERALNHYRSGKSNAAESEKAVAMIEKAVGFYPQNRAYKELRSKLILADLLYYKGNDNLQIALRDEGRGSASYAKQRKITVWLRNTSGKTLYINPDFFTLLTRNGKSLKYNNMMETGFRGKLAPGEKTAGVLYFRTLSMPRQLIFEHLVAGTVQREFP